jgi:hypothetical protein
MIFILAVTGVSIAMAIAASDFEQVSSVFDTSNMYRKGSFAASAVKILYHLSSISLTYFGI